MLDDRLLKVIEKRKSEVRKVNDEIVNEWIEKNEINLIGWIGEGGNGNAYEIEGDKVLKITSQFGEAAFAYDAIIKAPKGYVKIYSVENIYDVYNDFQYSIIVMDKLSIEKEIKKLMVNLTDVLDSNELNFMSDISEFEELFSDFELYLFNKINTIVYQNKNDFKMTDIHPYNVGLLDQEVVIFDQFHIDFDCIKYKILINKYETDTEFELVI